MALVPPDTLTKAERRTFGRLVRQLAQVGLDPAAKVPIAIDYVTAGARIAELRARKGSTHGKERAAATRALNIALAERRRLHGALFAGSRKPVPPPTKAEVLAASRQSEADAAWREHIWGKLGGSEVERVTREALLRAQFGGPSLSVLVDEDPVAAEAAVRAYNRGRRGQQPK